VRKQVGTQAHQALADLGEAEPFKERGAWRWAEKHGGPAVRKGGDARIATVGKGELGIGIDVEVSKWLVRGYSVRLLIDLPAKMWIEPVLRPHHHIGAEPVRQASEVEERAEMGLPLAFARAPVLQPLRPVGPTLAKVLEAATSGAKGRGSAGLLRNRARGIGRS
jgi:hypothetical protein